MKITSHLTKRTTRELKQNVNGILSKTTGKARIEKARLISSCNNNASRTRLLTNPEPETLSIKSKREKNYCETLAETIKRREIQISKSMDKLFKSSKIIITEALSNYLEKEDNIINKIAYEYKNRMDEYTDEKLNLLKKLRLGFEKYQLMTSTLFETLDKNHSQSLRARKDFIKDMEQMHIIHQSEIAQLYEEIDKSTDQFHKIMSTAVKEIQKKPSFASQLKSLFRL